MLHALGLINVGPTLQGLTGNYYPFVFHSWIKQQNKEHLLKNKINEAEKEKLTAHVKEISLKLDLKNLQSPTDIPPLNPMKEENIETIRMPNIPNSKRKASCNDNGPAPKQLKSARYRLIRILYIDLVLFFKNLTNSIAQTAC